MLAAAQAFAEHGYEKAKLADIANQAGTATGSLYSYFQNKEALFNAVVTPTLAAQLLRLLRSRVRVLKEHPGMSKGDLEQSPEARKLLTFWIEHRHVVLILFRGAQGTRYAHVRKLLIRQMRRSSLGLAEQTQPLQTTPEAMSFVLSKLFDRTLDMIADILWEYETPEDIQSAIRFFWCYQIAGLNSLLGVTKDLIRDQTDSDKSNNT